MKCLCPNCGKEFQGYSVYGTVFCSVACAFDTSTNWCNHWYSANHCVICKTERCNVESNQPKQLEFDFEETK